jgi:hypothetical protein
MVYAQNVLIKKLEIINIKPHDLDVKIPLKTSIEACEPPSAHLTLCFQRPNNFSGIKIQQSALGSKVTFQPLI